MSQAAKYMSAMISMPRAGLCAVALGLVFVGEPSRAQGVERSAPQASYPAASFRDARPQNALDMLVRLPGFSLDEGTAARGFGGVAGNVLIDGTRPATKDVTLSETLRRIPADAVERIEVLDGGAFGLDGANSRLVANVVRRRAAAGGGSWRVSDSVTAGGRHAPYAAASWTGTVAGINANASLEGGRNFQSVQPGREASLNGDRLVLEDGPIADLRRQEQVAGTLALAARVAELDMSLATSVRKSDFGRDTRFQVSRAASGVGLRTEREQDDNASTTSEVSLEAKRRVGRGEAKLIALQTWREVGNVSEAGSDFPTGERAGSRFRADERQSETILRGSWSPRWPTLSLDFAVEGVRTRLVSETLFSTIDEIGATPVEPACTRVGELRGSVEASARYTGIERWTFEAAVATEISRIQLDEPVSSANSYAFLKPRLGATWRASNRLTVSLRAARTVGQLNFSDFVGGQLVADESETETNSELQPSQADSLRLTVERRWGERGSVGVTFVGERVRDVVDLVPVGVGQGVGNLPKAERYGVDVLGTVPLDGLIEGADLTANLAWRDTSVRDPFNGRVRPLQGREYASSVVAYRQIVSPELTMGASLTVNPLMRTFRQGQSIVFEEGRALSLYAETTALAGIKARVGLDRLFGVDIRRELIRSTGVRGLSPIREIETRTRNYLGAISLQLEAAF